MVTTDDHSRRVLLFIGDRQNTDTRRALAQFKSTAFPRGWIPAVVDTKRRGGATAWYRIGRVPAIAVIDHGRVVASEHDFSPGSLRRLLERFCADPAGA